MQTTLKVKESLKKLTLKNVVQIDVWNEVTPQNIHNAWRKLLYATTVTDDNDFGFVELLRIKCSCTSSQQDTRLHKLLGIWHERQDDGNIVLTWSDFFKFSNSKQMKFSLIFCDIFLMSGQKLIDSRIQWKTRMSKQMLLRTYRRFENSSVELWQLSDGWKLVAISKNVLFIKLKD